MPKSRRRKKAKTGVVKMTPEVYAALLEQREAFRKKFGRDPGPGDPVIFDPDADEPTEISSVRIEAETLEAMRKAGTRPEVVYAYKKTGILLMKDSPASPRDRQAWEAAVKEFFLIEAAQAQTDRPDPSDWKTEIPELLVSGFSQRDLKKVDEILRAVAQIEGREPIKVITRIELAAVFLTMACECAYESAEATGSPGEGPNLYAKTEELVVRRAREIYAHGATGSG
jgi:hypothetical protein